MERTLIPIDPNSMEPFATFGDMDSTNVSARHWTVVRQLLRDTLDQDVFAKWITPLEAAAGGEGEIVLKVPSTVFFQGLRSYIPEIEKCQTRLGLDWLDLRFEVEPPATNVQQEGWQNHGTLDDGYHVGGAHPSQGKSAPSRPLSSECLLERSHVFESFVRGPSNQFALATCLNVAENPGRAYNPLFIYGSTGLGKTHLLHAVGNRVLERNPKAVVTYISSERFMNEMIYCIRFNKMFDFREKYRYCDVLLVDDIHFISGKKSTQEEFFHTFNTLYASKKQIVITSDQYPQEIPDIEERLRNRFQWGLIADIQPPDAEHRIAILYAKAEEKKIKLPQDVAEFIANQAKRNVRELEGALHRLSAFAALHGRRIDIQLAAETFQDLPSESGKRLTIEAIQKTVADHFKLRIPDLKSKKRQRALTNPRQIAMYLSRTLTNASYPEIGEKFGGKDHTTVMHAVRKIEKEKESDFDMRAQIDVLKRAIDQI